MTQFPAHLTLHQVVHGYTDGHRLLAASVRLAPQTQRVLTQMSDMSGPGMRRGFETYLTAYPLPDGQYALARTWYAAEMPRPGCVWTHTLLLSATAAGKLNPFTLLPYFIRPRSGEYGLYNAPLQVSLLPDHSTAPVSTVGQVVESAVASIFGNDDPVILPADSAHEYEELLLAIWNVQSAPLRRTFMFCSGALASRALSGRTFDLQVMPAERASRLAPKLKSVITTDAVASDWPKVVRSAFDGRSDVASFLRRFGAEDARRPYVGRLAAFLRRSRLLDARAEPASAIQEVAKHFPSASDAPLLKNELFGPRRRYFPEPDLEVVRLLVLSTGSSAFDPKALKIRARTTRLLRTDGSAAVEIGQVAARMAPTPLRTEFLQAVASAARIDTLLSAARDDANFAEQMIMRGSRLLETPSFWQSTSAAGLVSILHDTAALSPEHRLRGILGLVRSDVSADTPRLVRTLPPEQGIAVIRVLAARGRTREAEQLIRANTDIAADLLEVVHSKPKLSAIDAYLGAVSCNHASECGVSVWSKLIASSSRSPLHASAVNAYAFVAAIMAGNGLFAPVVAGCFEALHRSLAACQPPREVLDVLNATLISLGPDDDWDLCERLRRSLMRFFVDHGWPTAWFFASVKHRNTFKKCLASARSTKAGRKWLKAAVADVEQGKLRVNPPEYRMLCLAAAS